MRLLGGFSVFFNERDKQAFLAAGVDVFTEKMEDKTKDFHVINGTGFPSAYDGANSGNGGRPNPKRFPFNDIVLRNRLTALVVDGVDFCRVVEQGILRACGLETQGVDNGDAAVELIASSAKFDLIVIGNKLFYGFMLLHLFLWQATRRIRAMGTRCKMVGVSAFFSERGKQAFLAAGVDVYSEKPMSAEILVSILRELDGHYPSI
ncbi:two-component response regulator 24-like [Hibiscus syriacus]|uniref:two-component response regulator 24-like n=1 Tax=Hibiscus syriacus TaxID=106335 RepID=UPI0019243C1C|nr:two-component response regulator 24-like [Hibiscus syriacus]